MRANTYFDTRLISESVVFAVGWDLGGFCICPAITALPIAATETIIFAVMAKYFGEWYEGCSWSLAGKT